MTLTSVSSTSRNECDFFCGNEAKPIAGQELLSEIDILQKLSDRRKKLEEMRAQRATRYEAPRTRAGIRRSSDAEHRHHAVHPADHGAFL